MANRIVLGKGRGSSGTDYGLWISKPGKDVLTCDPEDLLFDSLDRKYGEILASGTFSGSTSVTVEAPNGEPPFVYLQSFNSLGGIRVGEQGPSYASYSFSGTSCTISMVTYHSSITALYVIISLGT